MIVRLGNVLYWAAWLAFSLLAASTEGDPNWFLACMRGLVGGALIWIMGCAFKNVLAGD